MSTTPESLVVLGSSLTALAVVRSCHACGLASHVIDYERGVATYSRYPRKHILGDVSETEVVDLLLRLAEAGPTALIADSDHWLRLVANHYQRLSEAFASVLHSAPDILELCLNKTSFLNWCEARSILTPKNYSVQGGAPAPGPDDYPLILRPERTMHNVSGAVPKAIEVEDQDALEHWLTVFEQGGATASVSQSLLRPNIRQYSIGAARNRRGELRIVTAEKVRSFPDQCAGGTLVHLVEHEPSSKLAEAVLNGLDYFGIAECEVMYDPDTNEAFLLEVNARPWVQFGLVERSGGEFLSFILGLKGDDDTWTTPRHNGRWINFGADAFVTLSGMSGVVRQGRLGWFAYLRSIVAANRYAALDISDPRPFIHLSKAFVRRALLRR